jgi:hypothetical protein
MDEKSAGGDTQFEAGLNVVRKRRLWLWVVIAIYVPAIWVTLQINPAFRVVGTVFVVWLVFLIIGALVSALAVCPRCGNYFHLNGMSLLYLRRCLHCYLHINADKTARQKSGTPEE